MIPAVRLGSTVFRMGADQLVRAPAAIRPRPGSEWWELVIHGTLAAPERWAGPPHGDPRRWDWGLTADSLGRGFQRREHLQRVARNLTPEQLQALWQDASAEAAELRRVLRGIAGPEPVHGQLWCTGGATARQDGESVWCQRP